MIDELLKFFVLLFVVVEPVTLVPVFASLTDGASERYKRKMSFKAVTVSGIVLSLFALGGAWFIRVMGISIDAFRIAQRTPCRSSPASSSSSLSRRPRRRSRRRGRANRGVSSRSRDERRIGVVARALVVRRRTTSTSSTWTMDARRTRRTMRGKQK